MRSGAGKLGAVLLALVGVAAAVSDVRAETGTGTRSASARIQIRIVIPEVLRLSVQSSVLSAGRATSPAGFGFRKTGGLQAAASSAAEAVDLRVDRIAVTGNGAPLAFSWNANVRFDDAPPEPSYRPASLYPVADPRDLQHEVYAVRRGREVALFSDDAATLRTDMPHAVRGVTQDQVSFAHLYRHFSGFRPVGTGGSASASGNFGHSVYTVSAP